MSVECRWMGAGWYAPCVADECLVWQRIAGVLDDVGYNEQDESVAEVARRLGLGTPAYLTESLGADDPDPRALKPGEPLFPTLPF